MSKGKTQKKNPIIDKEMQEKLGRRAKRLYALWWVLAALFSTGVSIYMAYQEAVNGIDVNVFPSTFQFALCGILGFVFIPLLVLVRKWAKAAGADKLYAKASKMFFCVYDGDRGYIDPEYFELLFPGPVPVNKKMLLAKKMIE